jgi:lantibiotic modifying enzyme
MHHSHKSLVAVMVLMLLSFGLLGQKSNQYLDATLKVERWLQTQEINKADSGLGWHNVKDSAAYSSDLYSGNSGVVLFYLELYAATKNKAYLQKAEKGFRYIRLTEPPVINELNSGLYTGYAGIIYTACELAKASGKAEYKNYAGKMLDALTNQVLNNDTIGQHMANDIIYGYAGIGLVYLYAHQQHLTNNALQQAGKIGALLLRRTTNGKGGIRWPMFMKDTVKNIYYPNFSHGTAGVAYFLTQLYLASGEKQYLAAALQAANHLQNITSDSGWIYHIEPIGTDRFYLSWCHGPAGTSRLYHQLYGLTKDAKWMTSIEQAAQSVMKCGVPEKQTKGFWNNVGNCCGSTGIADYFLYLHQAYQKKPYLEFSRHVTKHVLNQAVSSRNQLEWKHAENRRQPDLLEAQTGLMQGAAGIGLALLHQYYFDVHKKPTIVLPDNPFE